MTPKDKPRIKYQFKIRKDIGCHIGFFKGKGVLTFNATGAFITSQLTGDNSIKDISTLMKAKFPNTSEPTKEVFSIVKQLEKANLL